MGGEEREREHRLLLEPNAASVSGTYLSAGYAFSLFTMADRNETKRNET